MITTFVFLSGIMIFTYMILYLLDKEEWAGLTDEESTGSFLGICWGYFCVIALDGWLIFSLLMYQGVF